MLERLLVRPTAGERAARLPGDELVAPADAVGLRERVGRQHE